MVEGVKIRHSWSWQKPRLGWRQCQGCGLELPISRHIKVGDCNPNILKPKPDEGGLLTPGESSQYFNEGLGDDWDITGLLGAQDAKTAVIKDAECQARAERIKKRMEDKSYPEEDGLEFYFTDEEWRTLWEKEEVNEQS